MTTWFWSLCGLGSSALALVLFSLAWALVKFAYYVCHWKKEKREKKKGDSNVATSVICGVDLFPELV